MPILLRHLPWVVLFGSWDVAVSARDTPSVESRVDAQAALDQTRLPPGNRKIASQTRRGEGHFRHYRTEKLLSKLRLLSESLRPGSRTPFPRMGI
jgi:hypothetical protein